MKDIIKTKSLTKYIKNKARVYRKICVKFKNTPSYDNI